MAIAIILTDTHLSVSTEEINKSIFKQVIEKAIELGLKKVYHGGDIFDSRKAQPLSVLKTFESILDSFYDADIKLVAIPGNHDKNDYRSENSYLDVFRHHPAFTLYSNFGIEKLNESYNMALIPFFEESDTYMDYLLQLDKTISKSKKTFLLTHIAVNGVKNNGGSEVKNILTKDLFSKYENVLIGHYHNQSVVAKNITYIGSAFPQNYGEDNKKGFCIIDENGELDYITAEFPSYKKLVLDLNEYTPSQAEKLIEEYKNSDNNIRFIFKGTFEQVNAIDKTKFKKEGIDVKLESAEIQTGIEEAENDEFISFDKNGILQEFETFCEINKVQEIETGKKYLKQILN